MKILFVTSECVPYAKTGGLADVAGSLPKALRDIGIDARIFMPRYRAVSTDGLKEVVGGLPVPISSKTVYGRVLESTTPSGVPVYFLDQPHYFDRKDLYVENGKDYPDNAERFVFFSRAAVEFLRRGIFAADVVHANDWFAGLVPVYLRTLYARDHSVNRIRTLFSIHNLAYQGIFWHYDMHLTGLPWDLFRFDKMEFFGKLNFLKGGIIFSEIVSTVSERYAQEIMTPENGFGLDATIRKREKDLLGIINGVDYGEWNPATDAHIVRNYDESSLGGKLECKRDLQRLNNLPETDAPLLGIVSRLSDLKGSDLLEKAFDEMMSLGVQFVMLGTGDEAHEKYFADVARKYPLQAGVNLSYSDAMAHKIMAGSDIFLMPSRYEPCGLTQLYAMKYGTVPVVRAVGGLADTVREWDGAASGTGFRFDDYSAPALLEALRRALSLHENAKAWQQIRRNGMQEDWSWNRSAGKYAEAYERALRPR